MALLMSFKVDVKAMTVTVTKRFLKSDSYTKSAAVGKLVSCRGYIYVFLSLLNMRYANLTENKMGHKRGHHCLALFLNPLHMLLFALSLSSRCHFLNCQRPMTYIYKLDVVEKQGL